MEDDDPARLSIDDLDRIAASWRLQAQQGNKTTAAIAEAMESVARQRRAAALARARVLAWPRPWGPLQRAARWAVSRRQGP